MKAYLVSCELEVLIVADNARDALGKSREALEDALNSESPFAEEAHGLPAGWSGGDRVYGTTDGMTAEEALRLNCD